MIVTVTYDANGGVGAVPQGIALVGGTYTVDFAHNPTKSGKTFDGWATSANGAVVYSSGGTTSFTAATNVTLYAHYSS